MNFPDNADGDLLKSLYESGLDAAKTHVFEYDIEFSFWPPANAALDLLKEKYGELRVYEPEDDYSGYVVISIESKLSYEFVVNTQNKVTQFMSKYGGVCEAWANG